MKKSTPSGQAARKAGARSRAAEAIRDREVYQRLLLDSMAEGFYGVDRDGVTTICNAAFLRMLGFEREEEVIGRKLHDLIHHTHPDGSHYPKEQCPIYRCATSGQPAHVAGEFFFRLDGSAVPVEYWAYPVIRDGKVRGAITTFYDITERKRYEAERERLVSVAENSRDFIAMCDLEGNPIFVNRGGRDMVGLDYALDIRTTKIPEFFVPEERKFVKNVVLPAIAKEGRWVGELTFRHWKTEARIPVFSDLFRVDDPKTGRPLNFVTVTRDISQLKRDEAALRESEERYRSLFTSTPMAVFVCDRNAVIQAYNPRAVELWGREPVCGAEQHCGSLKLWLPDGSFLPHTQSPMLEVLRTGTPALNVEVFIERPDGLRLPVLVNFAAMKNEAGEIVGAITSFIDITERKRAEEALRKSEERFRAIADNIPQLAWMAEPGTEGQATWFNKAWLDYTGTTMEQNQGSGWQAVHHPEHAAGVIAKFEHHVRECLDWEDTFPLRGRDGNYRWFLSRMNVIRDEAGQAVRIFGTNTDVTEQRAAEEALRQSETQIRALLETADAARLSAEAAKARAEAATRAKDDFLAALSHELRTPLSPALLLATSLADDATLPPRIRADIDVIGRGIALQAQLVDDLLDITRITGGKLRLDLRPIDAHSVLQSAYEIVRAGAVEREIKVTLDLAAAHDCIKADAVRVQQIFWNVLKNAVKFTPVGGAIRVRTRNPAARPDLFEVEISDSGIGIEPEMLGHVFDAFVQEDHAGAHRFGGIGLGLAITRRLVELQNGRITAESAGRDRGATFRIELPLEAPELCATAESTSVAPAASAPVARRILLVEDHEQTRATLVRLLEHRGHTVTGVATTVGAREAAAAGAHDLVISDLGLPDGDGHALIAELREAHGLPAIALSGYGMEDDRERSRQSGFFIHLTKPIDIRALEDAIALAPLIRSARGETEAG